MTSTLSAMELKQTKWPKLEKSRRKLFADRLAGLTALSQDYKTLRNTLLNLGGSDVVALPDLDIGKLVQRGNPFLGVPVKEVDGELHRAHGNSALVWRGDKNLAIVTGYALSKDGLWRQHTWAWDGSIVLETTPSPRLAYWGFELNTAEAEAFAASELDKPVSPRTPVPSVTSGAVASIGDPIQANVAKMDKNVEASLNGDTTEAAYLALGAYQSIKDQPYMLNSSRDGRACIADKDSYADLKNGHSPTRSRRYAVVCKLVEDQGGKYDTSSVFPPRMTGLGEQPGRLVVHVFRDTTTEVLMDALATVVVAEEAAAARAHPTA